MWPNIYQFSSENLEKQDILVSFSYKIKLVQTTSIFRSKYICTTKWVEILVKKIVFIYTINDDLHSFCGTYVFTTWVLIVCTNLILWYKHRHYTVQVHNDPLAEFVPVCSYKLIDKNTRIRIGCHCLTLKLTQGYTKMDQKCQYIPSHFWDFLYV